MTLMFSGWAVGGMLRSFTWARRSASALRPSGPVAWTSRVLLIIAMPKTKRPTTTASEGHRGPHERPRARGEALRRAAAAGAIADQRRDQERVDGEDQQRRDDDRDPVGGADVVGVGRVRGPGAEHARGGGRGGERQRACGKR